MILTYRRYRIEISRDRALGGWPEIYWAVFRVRDGWEVTSGFGMYGNVREALASLKKTVDLVIDEYRGSVERWEARKGAVP